MEEVLGGFKVSNFQLTVLKIQSTQYIIFIFYVLEDARRRDTRKLVGK